MVDVQSPAPGLAHVVFLERAARDLDSSGSKYGQAAFLVLRLVDLLASEPRPGASDDLFGYQTAATGRYCEEQLEPGIDADHLLDVVRSASYAHRRKNPGLLARALLALAEQLESAARFDEALDVV